MKHLLYAALLIAGTMTAQTPRPEREMRSLQFEHVYYTGRKPSGDYGVSPMAETYYQARVVDDFFVVFGLPNPPGEGCMFNEIYGAKGVDSGIRTWKRRVPETK